MNLQFLQRIFHPISPEKQWLFLTSASFVSMIMIQIFVYVFNLDKMVITIAWLVFLLYYFLIAILLIKGKFSLLNLLIVTTSMVLLVPLIIFILMNTFPDLTGAFFGRCK